MITHNLAAMAFMTVAYFLTHTMTYAREKRSGEEWMVAQQARNAETLQKITMPTPANTVTALPQKKPSVVSIFKAKAKKKVLVLRHNYVAVKYVSAN